MIGKWARAAVSVLAISLAVSVVGPAVAVPAPAGILSGTAGQKQAWVRAEVIRLILAAAGDGRVLSSSLATLLLDNPGLAGEITAGIISVAQNGAEGLVLNTSLVESLADGVALASAQWVAQADAGSTGAAAALRAVNAAFAAAGVSRGSVFGARFAATLNLAGGVLLPPALAAENSPLSVIVPFIPGDSTVFVPSPS